MGFDRDEAVRGDATLRRRLATVYRLASTICVEGSGVDELVDAVLEDDEPLRTAVAVANRACPGSPELAAAFVEAVDDYLAALDGPGW